MRQPCELFVVDRLLPTLRGEVARILRDRGMSEEVVASRLGVTQATISHYARDRRGDDGLRDGLPDMGTFAEFVATELEGGVEGSARIALLCGACGALRSRRPPDAEELRSDAAAVPPSWELSREWRSFAPGGWDGQPCELVASRLLPFLRRRTAALLRTGHGMTQDAIADCLQVSQALVSRYLREGGAEDLADRFPEIDARASLLADFLASGMPPPSSVAAVCALCNVAWTRNSACQCVRVYPSLKPLAMLEAPAGR